MALEDFNSARSKNGQEAAVNEPQSANDNAGTVGKPAETKAETRTEAAPLYPKGSQVFNFLWLNLDMPPKPDPDDGTICEPLKPKYIDNVRKAGLENPKTDVFLWVDSRRLTEKQMIFLQEKLEEDLPNVKLKDLRSIPAYDGEPLYNEAETNRNWRNSGQTSTIWRQVDAAKILISLQGDYDQSFFADLDHAHLAINSEKVQGMLEKRGLMIGSSGEGGYSVENQLWGLTRARRPFFESYYVTALKSAYRGDNAWDDLVEKVRKELYKNEAIPYEEIVLPISGDGTGAEHTGHEFRDGFGKSKPAVVDKGELSRVFNRRSARPPAESDTLAIEITWAPAIGVDTVSRTASGIFYKLKKAMGVV